ncbi:MAG: patatin-like phospholipase family protein [Myxococcaceae bacterium]
MTTTSDRKTRALVLGGGGISGIAWELGILSGLVQAGVNLEKPDLIMGTSAGSIAGAQVAAGLDLEARYQAQLESTQGEFSASLGPCTMARLSGPC